MRLLWNTLGLVSMILGLAGCQDKQVLRPPPNKEALRLPPEEQRYIEPMQFPKETLNQDPGKYKPGDLNTPGSLGQPGRSGMGMTGRGGP